VSLVVCVALGLLVGGGNAYAQSFELRSGQWDFTMSGLAAMLGDTGKLPPEVRAQIEARANQPTNYQSCLTAQDLKDLNIGKQDDEDEVCRITSKRITATTADITRECTGENKRSETMHYEALSKESLRATIKTVSARGPATLTITGKWIGATCKED